MKYIKKFESIDIKDYIIATMPQWNGDIFMFRTSNNVNGNYSYSSYFYIEDNNDILNVKVKFNNSGYDINMLDILFQTDDIIIAREKLKELYHLYKNVNKYNL